MGSPTPGEVTFYRAVDVARLLHCSEWWVKEQARQRRIPFCWIGGSYLFTDDHITEIVRLFEVRPTEFTPAVSAPRVPRQRPATEAVPAIQLSARVPRRARAFVPDVAA
jgi:hypothetical protein